MRNNTPLTSSTEMAHWPMPAVKQIRRRATLALALFTTAFAAQLAAGVPAIEALLHRAELREAREAALRMFDRREDVATLRR